MEAALEDANIVLAAGPAGVRVLRQEAWSSNSAIEVLADDNAADRSASRESRPGMPSPSGRESLSSGRSASAARR